MDSYALLLLMLMCFLILFRNGVEEGNCNISGEKDLEFEKQLEVLNKLSTKTIVTDYGDIFDCVDFYEQPAFDHARLNNYTIEYEWKLSSLNKNAHDPLNIRLKNGGCPYGTVPIRRTTKEDLIREILASKLRSLSDDNKPDVHYAVLRTKPGINKFVGAGSTVSIWRPVVDYQQYSAARLKIAIGSDSIEAGWRVDPILYGRVSPYLYVRTDAGKSHCFDTKCGFVMVDQSLPVGNPISNSVSEPGGPTKEIELFIFQDISTGNWFLEAGQDHKKVGFWPKGLFTDFANLGASAEWGGEVLFTPGSPRPLMGAGYVPSLPPKLKIDAYFRSLSLRYESKTVNVADLDSVEDGNIYQIKDAEILNDGYFSHLMVYGGPMKRT